MVNDTESSPKRGIPFAFKSSFIIIMMPSPKSKINQLSVACPEKLKIFVIIIET